MLKRGEELRACLLRLVVTLFDTRFNANCKKRINKEFYNRNKTKIKYVELILCVAFQ